MTEHCPDIRSRRYRGLIPTALLLLLVSSPALPGELLPKANRSVVAIAARPKNGEPGGTYHIMVFVSATIRDAVKPVDLNLRGVVRFYVNGEFINRQIFDPGERRYGEIHEFVTEADLEIGDVIEASVEPEQGAVPESFHLDDRGTQPLVGYEACWDRKPTLVALEPTAGGRPGRYDIAVDIRRSGALRGPAQSLLRARARGQR